MSGRNRVNPDHYKVSGRLTTDELARERHKQQPQGAKVPLAGARSRSEAETAAAPTSAGGQSRLRRGARPAGPKTRRRTQ